MLLSRFHFVEKMWVSLVFSCSVLLFQPCQCRREWVMRRRLHCGRKQADASVRFEIAGMLVIVAVQAQQLPVAAIGRIVIVVVVTVMYGQLLHVGSRELSRATSAYPRIHFQRTLTVTALAHLRRTAGFGYDLVQLCRIRLFSLHTMLSFSIGLLPLQLF